MNKKSSARIIAANLAAISRKYNILINATKNKRVKAAYRAVKTRKHREFLAQFRWHCESGSSYSFQKMSKNKDDAPSYPLIIIALFFVSALVAIGHKLFHN